MRNMLMALVAVLPALAWAQPAVAPAAGVSPALSPNPRAETAAARSEAAAAPRGNAAARREAAATRGEATATRAARPATPAQAAQHQRMRDCNAEARNRGLTSTARASFMRPCLGGNMPNAGG